MEKLEKLVLGKGILSPAQTKKILGGSEEYEAGNNCVNGNCKDHCKTDCKKGKMYG